MSVEYDLLERWLALPGGADPLSEEVRHLRGDTKRLLVAAYKSDRCPTCGSDDPAVLLGYCDWRFDPWHRAAGTPEAPQ